MGRVLGAAQGTGAQAVLALIAFRAWEWPRMRGADAACLRGNALHGGDTTSATRTRMPARRLHAPTPGLEEEHHRRHHQHHRRYSCGVVAVSGAGVGEAAQHEHRTQGRPSRSRAASRARRCALSPKPERPRRAARGTAALAAAASRARRSGSARSAGRPADVSTALDEALRERPVCWPTC
jgi:hypothetical protein